jgi:hypothetical protein
VANPVDADVATEGSDYEPDFKRPLGSDDLLNTAGPVGAWPFTLGPDVGGIGGFADRRTHCARWVVPSAGLTAGRSEGQLDVWRETHRVNANER